MDQWALAQIDWLDWIDQQWKARLQAWQSERDKARTTITNALDALPYDKDGRVRNIGGNSLQARRKFRATMDRALVRSIRAGYDIFQISGQRNDAGVYVGNVKPDFRAAVRTRLRDSFNANS